MTQILSQSLEHRCPECGTWTALHAPRPIGDFDQRELAAGANVVKCGACRVVSDRRPENMRWKEVGSDAWHYADPNRA